LAVRDGLTFVITYLPRPADFQQVSLDPKRLVYAKPPVTGTVGEEAVWIFAASIVVNATRAHTSQRMSNGVIGSSTSVSAQR
jgi:hypothetical protein